MKHLREAEDELFKSIFKRYGHVLLLLDYDGTLTPIVSRPQKALLDRRTKAILKKLAKKKNMTLGIISGRRLKDIRKLVGIGGIYYAGNHGLEIMGPGIRFAHPLYDKFRKYLKEIKAILLRNAGKIRGALVEDKRVTLSLHYRLVKKSDFKKLRKIFTEACRPYIMKKQIRITSGKKVFETRPCIKWGKGDALRAIEDLVKGPFKTLTIFMGDDNTDEDAFSVLNEERGVSIFVGRRKKTKAKFFLRNTEEARGFLGKLAEL